MKTDMELQRDVMDELEWEPSVDHSEIAVSVEDGIVMLNGSAKSLPEKWAAERAAARVTGVKAVTNEIEVRLPGFSERTDVDIARAALNALEWNASVPRDRIQVTVENGWITLKGIVHWQFQKTAAQDAVHHLTGVKGVTNLIDVKPALATAGDIETKIERALQRNAALDARRITVEVRNGKAILRGSVRSWIEREEAERAAWSAPGVFDLESFVKIEP